MTPTADFDLPTPRDADRAKAAIRALSLLRPDAVGDVAVRVQQGHNEAEATLPAAAFALLLELLGQLANGNAVTIVPIHAELTTQQAADLLNVSRPHLVSLLESNQLPHRRVGTHRRVMFKDIMAVKQRDALSRKTALDELASEAQLHNLGY